MKSVLKIAAASAVFAVTMGANSAFAWSNYVHPIGMNDQFGQALCDGPRGILPCGGGAPIGMPMPGPMGGPGGMPTFPPGPGFDPWAAAGPFAGTATAGVLMDWGVPPPVAGWAGARVNGNFQAAGRETTVLNQGIRAGTGISVRDIEEHGITGGRCSVFNNPFGGNGC